MTTLIPEYKKAKNKVDSFVSSCKWLRDMSAQISGEIDHLKVVYTDVNTECRQVRGLFARCTNTCCCFTKTCSKVGAVFQRANMLCVSLIDRVNFVKKAYRYVTDLCYETKVANGEHAEVSNVQELKWLKHTVTFYYFFILLVLIISITTVLAFILCPSG